MTMLISFVWCLAVPLVSALKDGAAPGIYAASEVATVVDEGEDNDSGLSRLAEFRKLIGNFIDPEKMLLDPNNKADYECPMVHALREISGWDLGAATEEQKKEAIMEHIPLEHMAQVGMAWGQQISKVLSRTFKNPKEKNIFDVPFLQYDADPPEDSSAGTGTGGATDFASAVPERTKEEDASRILKNLPGPLKTKMLVDNCLNGRLDFPEIIGCITGYMIAVATWKTGFALGKFATKLAYTVHELNYASVLSFVQVMHYAILGDDGPVLTKLEDVLNWCNLLAVEFNSEIVTTIEWLEAQGEQTAGMTGIHVGSSMGASVPEWAKPKMKSVSQAQMLGGRTAKYLMLTIFSPFLPSTAAGMKFIKKRHAEKMLMKERLTEERLSSDDPIVQAEAEAELQDLEKQKTSQAAQKEKAPEEEGEDVQTAHADSSGNQLEQQEEQQQDEQDQPKQPVVVVVQQPQQPQHEEKEMALLEKIANQTASSSTAHTVEMDMMEKFNKMQEQITAQQQANLQIQQQNLIIQQQQQQAQMRVQEELEQKLAAITEVGAVKMEHATLSATTQQEKPHTEQTDRKSVV